MRPTWPLLGCLVVAACAPQGCYYPTGSLSFVCPALERAAEAKRQAAQQEQQRQALIQQLGGEANYRAHMAQEAAKQRAQDLRIQYSGCLSRMPIPVSEFQEQWERRRCIAEANRIVDGPP